jgi:hypothetical protein
MLWQTCRVAKWAAFRIVAMSTYPIQNLQLTCIVEYINPLTQELNPPAQRCLTRFFTADFASWTVHLINICVKNQQMQQLFIQFINYVW